MLYYRLLHVVRAWEYTIYVLAFIVIGYTLGEALVIIFACSPIQKNWDVTINGSCINRPVLYLMTTITNTASDVVLILVPLYIVWGLRLPLIQKIGVAFLLGLGSLSVLSLWNFCVILLTPITKSPRDEHPPISYYMAPSTYARPTIQDCPCKSIRVSPSYDYQLISRANANDVYYHSNIEANFMILCASLPYLRQFCRHLLPRFLSGDVERNLQSSSPRYTPTRKMQTPRMTTASEDLEMNGIETGGVERTHVAGDRDGATLNRVDTSEL